MPNIGDAPSNAPLAGGYAKLTTYAGEYFGANNTPIIANNTWTELRSTNAETRTLFTPTYACVIVGTLGIPIVAQGDNSSPYRLDRNAELTVGLDRVRAGSATPFRWKVRPEDGPATNPPYFKAFAVLPFNLALTASVEHEITLFVRSSSVFTIGTVDIPIGDKETGTSILSWIQIPS